MLAAAGLAMHAASAPLAAAALRAQGSLTAIDVTRRVTEWAQQRRERGGLGGAVFGDSVFAPHAPDKRFVHVLGERLAAAGLPIDMIDVTNPGFSPIQFYCLLDGVLAGRPDFVIVEVNLRTFAPDWIHDVGLRMPQLSADLSLLQVWRARRALATQQIGLLTPLQYRLDKPIGTIQLVNGVRVLSGDAFDAAGTRLNDALGLTALSSLERFHRDMTEHVSLDDGRAQAWYGQDFVSSPAAEALRALARELRDAGVATLFVLAPAMRGRLHELGISLRELDARTDALRRMVGAAPSQWIDTAVLFRPVDFVDGFHLRPDLVGHMTEPVVARLRRILAPDERSAP